MKAAMKVHAEKCDGSGLTLNINKKQARTPTPSYSMIHALEEGFISMIYSCIYDTDICTSCVHRKHAVRLILVKRMVDMWHESLYHSEAKS